MKLPPEGVERIEARAGAFRRATEAKPEEARARIGSATWRMRLRKAKLRRAARLRAVWSGMWSSGRSVCCAGKARRS